MTSSLKPGLILLASLLAASSARAGFVTDTLGSAGPSHFALLTLSGASDIALNGPGTTNGNVGITTGTLSLNSSSPPAVVGNVLLGSTASINGNVAQQVQGTVLANQNTLLNAANTDATNASSTFAALSPTQTVPGGQITSTTTINGAAGVNVVNVSKINLGNGQTLTLNGPAGAQFVVNDTGNLVLNSGKIILTGGLTPSDVVINVTSSGNQVSASGGLNNESVINGILLAPKSGIAFAPGLINGEAIAGGSTIHFVSGANLTFTVLIVPEPASATLMAIGACGLVPLVKRRAARQRV
jgi:hypothetical protein